MKEKELLKRKEALANYLGVKVEDTPYYAYRLN